MIDWKPFQQIQFAAHFPGTNRRHLSMNCSHIRYPLIVLLLFCSLRLFAQTPWTSVLPGSRATNWSQAGVVGGIPSASWTQCTNTQCEAVTTAGTSASAAQILAALQNAPANTYVLLGPGTYHLTTGICVTGASNVELRGSGANSTFLVFTSSANCMGGAGGALIGFQSSDGTYPQGVSPSQVAPWNGGAQGATSITFPNGLGSLSVTPNQTLLMLDECNTGFSGNSTTGSGGTGNNGVPCPTNNANNDNPALAVDNGQFFNCATEYGLTVNPGGSPYGCAFQGADTANRYERGQIEIVQATSCSPGCNSTGSVTVNITPGLIHPNWSSSQSPEAWVVQPSQNLGFKDLSIDGTAASGGDNIEGIGFNNVTNVWVQRVRIISPQQIGIWLVDTSHASILDNYIYNVGQNYTYQDSWGIKDGPGEANLFQNNIIQATRVAIANGEGPAVGDVTAYNYAVNQIDQSDYIWGAFWQHANGDDYDLYEGNVGTYIAEDDVHGTHDFITSFRNLLTGWESCANGNCGSYTAKDAGTQAITDFAYNRYANIIGNVLGDGVPFGDSTQPYQYQFINTEYYTGTNAPYNIGSGNYANGSSPNIQIPVDNLTVSSAVRWGNYDLYNNATLFCTAPGEPTSNCVEDERAESSTESPVFTGLSSPSTSLPASFYLSGVPSWWPSSIPFPAIGPDVFEGDLGQCNGPINTAGQYNGLLVLETSQCAGSGMSAGWAGGHANAIPAMACFLNVMGGTPDGIGSALAFNPGSCYPSSGMPQAATPTFSPIGGTYSTAQSVTISDSTPGSTIYYTTNGTTPTTGSAVYTSPINVAASETLEAIATSSGYTQSAVGSASYVISAPQAATPTFSPAAGVYTSAQSVTISDSTSGATIYYTTNGTTPTTSSPVYGSPINVSTSETLEAMATASGFTQSATATANYSIGTITLVQEPLLQNNEVCNPTCPAITTTAIGAGDLLFVSATNTGNGSATSNITSISCAPNSCGTWVLPGSLCQQWSANTGGISCAYVLSSTAGATSVTVTMSASTTEAALYLREYHTTSAGGFSYDSAASNLITTACTSCVTPSLTLSGTDDVVIAGGTPNHGFSAMNSPYGDVQVDAAEGTIIGDVLNTASGAGATITQGSVAGTAAVYTIAFKAAAPAPAATPTFSPAAGTYTSAQSVTISDATSGSTIYYTTNGSTPTTSSSVYSSPINVSTSETLKAIATAPGYTQSAVGSAAYTINLPAATPTFSPGAGTYTSVQSVAISDTTSGATIYFTTNGSTPTTSSSVYSSPISVGTTETVKAIATATGFSQSAVGSAAYTINLPPVTITLVQDKVLSNGGSQIVCNPTCPALTVNSTGAGNLLYVGAVATGNGGGTQTNIASISCSPTCGSWVLPGATCQKYSANTGGVDCGYVLSSTAGATSVTVTMSGNTPYGTVYFREYHTTQSTGFRFDTVGTNLSSSCTSCVTPSLTLTGLNDVLIAGGAPGGGFTAISSPYGDVQTESYTLTATGDLLNTSSGAGATITQNASDPAVLSTIAFTDTPVLPTPTFSPVGGTYTGAQSVSISDTVSGTTVYYTTNGTTPTTSSTLYTGPINVGSSETIEAIATKTGYLQSPVGSSVYVIKSISLVQDKVLGNNGNQIVCNPTCPAMTITSTGAGDLLFISAVATGTGGGTQTNIASIACSPSCGSWVLPGAACQLYNASTGGVDCGYVLSSSAGATTVTVTMSGNTPYGTVYFREYHTSATAGFSLDKIGTSLNSSCTSCVTPSLALTGTNDVLIATGAPGGGFTGISSPYGDVQTENYTLTAMGDILNTNSGAGATITQNAADPAVLFTIAFKD
jgi:hypothetical protein